MISIYRADTFETEVEFFNAQGNAIDLTGKTLRFVVKRHPSDQNLVMDKQISVSGNKATLKLESTETNIPEGIYWFGFIIQDTETYEHIVVDRLQILTPLRSAI